MPAAALSAGHSSPRSSTLRLLAADERQPARQLSLHASGNHSDAGAKGLLLRRLDRALPVREQLERLDLSFDAPRRQDPLLARCHGPDIAAVQVESGLPLPAAQQ